MTMKIRNVSPYGPLDTPLLQHVDIVDSCEVVTVSDEQGRALLAQFENWAPVDKAAIATCADLVAEQTERELADTGEPSQKSGLKPEWVAYAAGKGDPDPSGKTKAELIEQYGSEVPDPHETAAAMAQRGEELAAAAPAPVDPSGTPPAGQDDDNAKGDQS